MCDVSATKQESKRCPEQTTTLFEGIELCDRHWIMMTKYFRVYEEEPLKRRVKIIR